MILLIIFSILAILADTLFAIAFSWEWWLIIPMAFVFFATCVLIYALICWLLAVFIPKNDTKPPRKFYTFITHLTCRFLLKIYNVKIIVEGKELLKKLGSFLFISNHQSNLDPICQIASYDRKDLTYIMKDDFMNVPMVGNWLCSSGHLPLDRVNNRNAIITINKSVNRINQGYPIGAYPEGTRSKSKDLGEFKDGLFKVAVKSRAPIVVTIIDNAYRVKSRFPFRRTKVLLKVCKVIDYEEIKEMNTHQISEIVRNIVVEELQKSRQKYSWLN